MGRYYARDGEEITLREWSALMEVSAERPWADFCMYKRVAETTVGAYWISTVWLGLDHSWLGGPPLIFETMVFQQGDGPALDIDCNRYSTEEQALAGHEETVLLVRATSLSLEEMTDETVDQ